MRTRLALVLVGWMLVACGAPAPITPSPLPTLEALYVYHPASLGWMAGEMAQCAQLQPGLGLYRVEVSTPPDISAGHIWLGWGIPPEGAYRYTLGIEALEVIVHPSRAQTTISDETLSSLFTGKTLVWDDGTPVQVWVYPIDDPLWTIFAAAMALEHPSPNALVAPDPQAMLAAIAHDPTAIGLLPEHWLDQTVRRIELNNQLTEKLRQPITATYVKPPEGILLAWLACLQEP